MLLKSPLLSALPALHHGFSTRLGGVSDGCHSTWNFGPESGARAKENRRRLAVALGFHPDQAIVEVQQVHGIDAVVCPVDPDTAGDALVTDTADTLVGVRTADCTPVLLAALDNHGTPVAVAAAHAGWRGATAGILASAIDKLRVLGTPPAQIMAAIGPCISAAHFEVGDEVVEAAKDALNGQSPAVHLGSRGRQHLDLVDLCRRLLLQAGLHRDHIDIVPGCTHDNAALFYSYRRDAGQTGRHISAIGFREVA